VAMLDADLRALGNAGHPDARKEIEPFIAHAEVRLRAAAARALRRIPGAEIDESLASMALQDTNKLVRRTAVDAMRKRSPTAVLVSTASQCARLDSDVNTRLEAVRALAHWSPAFPSARESLEWVAQNEPNERLRTIAAESL
jgi:HEAT repeat protein